jgi:hypothetical protein
MKGALMTNDELETRIVRLETRCTGLAALVNTLLPGIAPEARNRAVAIYGHYCETMATQMQADRVPESLATMHLNELATLYSGLQGAVKLLER